MCLRKIFPNWFKPDPITDPIPSTNGKYLISAAINNYPGSDNDLRGCLNDQINLCSVLADFSTVQLKDSQVTIDRFCLEIEKIKSVAVAGDTVVVAYSGHGTYVPCYNGTEVDGKDEGLYLYDGFLLDDKFGKTLDGFAEGVRLIVILDSCFSESATRALNLQPNPNRGRFNPTVDIKVFKGKLNLPRQKLQSDPVKWLVFSACSEHETAADAYIGDKYVGAYTHFLHQIFKNRDLTYEQAYNEVRKYLPSSDFSQTPTLEGPEWIKELKLFT